MPIRHRHPTRLLLLLLAVIVAAGGAAVIAPTDAAPTQYPVPMRSLSVYAGSARPDAVRAFEQNALSGTSLPMVMEHVDMRDWDHIAENGWFLRLWRGTGKKLVITTSPMPWGYSLQDAANGAFDGYWRRQLQQFVDYGFGDAILRVAHEFNCCYPWEATRDPQAFIRMFRRYVGIARSIPGQNFTFDWNPVAGGGNGPAAAAYPGDDVVDVIGLDIYDDAIHGADPVVRWNNMLGMLQWHRDFAAAHGKPMSFPEWGLNITPSQPERSGGDNPYFITQMRNWIGSNNVLYANYFSHNNPGTMSDILDGQFPNSLNEFRRVFSTPMSSGTPTAPPAPPTTTTTAAPPPPPPTTTTTTAAPRPPSTPVTTTTTTVPAGAGSGTSGAPSASATPQDGAGPAAPTNFTATAINGVVTLRWTASPTADGYNIFRNGQHIAWPLQPGLSSYTDRPPAGTHTYYLRGYNGQGNGPSTTAITITVGSGGTNPTPPIPPVTTTTTTVPAGGTSGAPSSSATPQDGAGPAAPTNFTATAINGVVTLRWTASPTADGYNIFRNGQHIAWPLQPGLSSYTDRPPAGTHTYYLRGYNGQGNGPSTTAITITVGSGGTNPTPPIPPVTTTTTTVPAGGTSGAPSSSATPQDGAGPAAPTNFTATAINGVVTLRWTASPTADGYNIFRNGQHIAWPLQPGLSSYTDRPPAGTHTYYLRGYNGQGNGPSTTAITITVG